MRFFILIVFFLSVLPGYCNEEIINEFVTDTKIKPGIEKVYSKRRFECKNKPGKVGLNLDDGKDHQIICPVITCPIKDTCSFPVFKPNLKPSYRFSVSLVEDQNDSFRLNISNINYSSGIFSYKVKSIESEVSYKDGRGYISGNAVIFSLPVYNWGQLLSSTCIGFLQANGDLTGTCTALDDSGKNGIQSVGAKFKTLSEPPE